MNIYIMAAHSWKIQILQYLFSAINERLQITLILLFFLWVSVSPLSVLNVYSNVGFYWLWHKLLYKTDKLEGDEW